MPQNSKSQLPGAVNNLNEAEIMIRKERYMKAFKQHINGHFNSEGFQLKLYVMMLN